MRYVVIMAGGSGTRLWPLSRQGAPKQLLKLIGGKSLLRLAFERSLGSVPPERILVCTGRTHIEAVAADLPEIPAANILGEPVGRDSLNAVAWPAAVIAARDPEAVIAQVTADHVIEPVSAFLETLDEAYRVAETVPDVLVTLGVVPTSPHTGYGYLHRGEKLAGFDNTHRVVEFREKPDAETAARYVDSGEYWWNAGMFVWRAAALLEQLRVLLPETHASVLELSAHPERLDDIFPGLHKTSVDYGVMEPVSQGKGKGHVAAVALPITWRDVGGYASLAGILTQDEAGNALMGAVVQLDAHDNILINNDGPDSLIAVAGLSGMVIVRTPEITLAIPVEQAERVKELVARVTMEAGLSFA